MFNSQEAQYQLFLQTAFGNEPGSPNGISLPRQRGFNATRSRNIVDNPQEFGDGYERQFALGNKIGRATGNLVPNLNFFGYLLKLFCGSIISAAFTGVLRIDVTNGGSGYTSAPTVNFAGGGGGTGAAAVSIVVAGKVVSIIVTNHGTG